MNGTPRPAPATLARGPRYSSLEAAQSAAWLRAEENGRIYYVFANHDDTWSVSRERDPAEGSQLVEVVS